jgi:hypothetical protein
MKWMTMDHYLAPAPDWVKICTMNTTPPTLTAEQVAHLCDSKGCREWLSVEMVLVALVRAKRAAGP